MKNVVKADLHLHTVYSDGVSTPLEYLEMAEFKGIKIISITDHNTFKGSREAMKIVKERNFNVLIIPGAEIRTNIGDILVYCPEIPEVDHAPRDIYELSDWASERDCILVPAHPLDIFRHGIGLINLFKYDWKVVEVYNGGVIIPLVNEITYSICRRMKVSCIGNSDAHHVSSMAMCYTFIRCDNIDVESVIKSIVNGFVEPKSEKYVRRVKYRVRSSIIRRSLKIS